MGGMPWDDPQQNGAPRPPPRYTPPPQPPYVPPPGRPYDEQGAQRMRPDVPSIPVVARNPQTGESVKLDIGQQLAAAVQKELSAALAANRDNIEAAGRRAVTRAVDGKPKPKDDGSALDEAVEDFEGAWQGGPVTQRTLFQGMAVDMGFAMIAVLSTVLQPGVDLFDKQLWTVTGVLMAKTVVQTFISWATKAGAGR